MLAQICTRFQSTLPLRGATVILCQRCLNAKISIHAPLTGSDELAPGAAIMARLFQSTLPLRGATVFPGQKVIKKKFQSTLPLRGATRLFGFRRTTHLISIHAPLTGSDLTIPWYLRGDMDFNPRSPYGERRGREPPPVVSVGFQSTLPLRGATTVWRACPIPMRFQSTLPLRGATLEPLRVVLGVEISIHAPLTGSDRRRPSGRAQSGDFNPRSPYGERPSSSMALSSTS